MTVKAEPDGWQCDDCATYNMPHETFCAQCGAGWSQAADDAITAARFAGDAMAAERARRS